MHSHADDRAAVLRSDMNFFVHLDESVFLFLEENINNNTYAVSLYITNKNKQNCITVNKANKIEKLKN